MPDINNLLGAEEVAKMIQSWLAWSATNIMFGPDGRLLLGVRSNAQPRAIPEPGDLALIGGFNTEVRGPAMLADVANAHAKVQLGIDLVPEQCSGFLACEYDMAAIPEPLKTAFGPLSIKRVAFERIVCLTDAQVADLKPQGKLRDIRWVSEDEFGKLVEGGQLSFSHQVGHVQDAFNVFENEKDSIFGIGSVIAMWL